MLATGNCSCGRQYGFTKELIQYLLPISTPCRLRGCKSKSPVFLAADVVGMATLRLFLCASVAYFLLTDDTVFKRASANSSSFVFLIAVSSAIWFSFAFYPWLCLHSVVASALTVKGGSHHPWTRPVLTGRSWFSVRVTHRHTLSLCDKQT